MIARFNYDTAIEAASTSGREFVVAAPKVADRLWKSSDPIVRAGLDRIISECAAEIESNVTAVGATQSEATAIVRAWRSSVDRAADAIKGRAHH